MLFYAALLFQGCGPASSAVVSPYVLRAADRSLPLELGDGPWQVVHRLSDEKYSLYGWRIVPRGQTVWTEQVIACWRRLESREQETVGSHLAGFTATLTRQCPQAVLKVVSRRDDDIIYEWTLNGCSSKKARDEHAIVHLFQRDHGLYRISYVKRVPALAAEERATWIRRLSTR